ncbi:hypothetical protein [Arthrobacter sp. B3I4]|uniref:hypothetical protein n=1 Tax=Arthrobacter sp. B3I4 TaxID=3042267 RepID=UPI002780ED43|nr:hypothetical protein [Arthrobacter sp. B3I4]MDQ0754212.1 putative lipoprotein YajG [Arthrobacter sp. B3I4]
MKKSLPAVVLAAGMLLSGCAGTPTPAASTTPRMNVDESCKFLNTDTFTPTGSDKEKAAQIGRHYQEVADKVAPEVGEPIQKMADIMKQVGESSTGVQTSGQLTQLRQQMDRIGQHCK